jgi:hypothetical protein
MINANQAPENVMQPCPFRNEISNSRFASRFFSASVLGLSLGSDTADFFVLDLLIALLPFCTGRGAVKKNRQPRLWEKLPMAVQDASHIDNSA